jgi:hypothetical protein
MLGGNLDNCSAWELSRLITERKVLPLSARPMHLRRCRRIRTTRSSPRGNEPAEA